MTALNYNYFRDYDPQTGRYIESDPIGLDAGINTYTYVQDGPIGVADPLGLVARGGGWSNPRWTKMKQAEAAIRQELPKNCSCAANSGNGCIPCDVAKNLLDRLNNSEVVEAPLGGDCGFAGPGYKLYLSPAAFTKKCDCLASTLYHELLHNAGYEHDATENMPGIRELEKKCMSNLCKGDSK